MEYRGQQFTFETTAKLAEGGMAEVYLASRIDDDTVLAAIKVPLPSLPSEFRDLFLREAEAALRVQHPNVVRLLDWGAEPPFIAYEYQTGGTLAQEIRIRHGGQQFWAEGESAAMFQQLVAGMAAVNKEVIHRDLKPENIFEDGDTLRISDFGISKYVGEGTRSRTFKQWGTAPYMAPETFRGESVDWRSDQYSLGVVFYEIATLERPFVGDWDELERLHLYERPLRITKMVPDVSERLASFVGRMLEKRATERFQSWDDLAAELQVIATGAAEASAGVAEDPLARLAADGVEQVRARELEHQRHDDHLTERTRARQELVDFTAQELFGNLRARVD